MCKILVGNTMCCESGCRSVISYNSYTKQEKCDHVIQNNLEFGQCHKPITSKSAPITNRSERQICDDCDDLVTQMKSDHYTNAAQNIRDSMEAERKRDEERRARKAAEGDQSKR